MEPLYAMLTLSVPLTCSAGELTTTIVMGQVRLSSYLGPPCNL